MATILVTRGTGDLVRASVYTFDVSKTTLEDKGMVLIHIRSRNACRRERCWLHCLPNRHTHV